MNDAIDARAGAKAPAVPAHGVSLREAFWTWMRVAALSFGGPAGQIAVMHRILVEEKRWVSEERFLHALNYCMLLPGPEAQQLATYIGWLMHRTRGGIMAGGLFILPGIISIMALSYVYAGWGNVPIVVGAVLRPQGGGAGDRDRGGGPHRQALAEEPGADRSRRRGLCRHLLFQRAVSDHRLRRSPHRLCRCADGVHGISRRQWPWAKQDRAADVVAESLLGEQMPEHARPTVARALQSSSVWLALWLVPVVTLLMTLGGSNVFSQIAVFFSKMAMVTFGGAYAVLAYVAQQAVEHYGWLKPGEMLDGLGMAETTPGPLIMVLQFVGFMAAYRDPGGLSPMLAGTLGGLLATWVTFTPCFLWIFLGAPFVEKLRGNRSLNSALVGPHRRRCRRDLEPCHLVCHPHRLSPDRAGAGIPAFVRCARSHERRRCGVGSFGGRGCRHLPLQAGHDPDLGRLLRCRRGPAFGGSDRMTGDGKAKKPMKRCRPSATVRACGAQTNPRVWPVECRLIIIAILARRQRGISQVKIRSWAWRRRSASQFLSVKSLSNMAESVNLLDTWK